MAVNIIFIAVVFLLKDIGNVNLLMVDLILGGFFSWIPSYLIYIRIKQKRLADPYQA